MSINSLKLKKKVNFKLGFFFFIITNLSIQNISNSQTGPAATTKKHLLVLFRNQNPTY